jgi:hypothetical protein
MTNINKQVWRYIDSHTEIRKNILEGLINISALARKIAKDEGLERSVDAVISAIRRYEGQPEKKKSYHNVYELLKKAKMLTKTKLASLLIKRTEQTEKKIVSLFTKVQSKRGPKWRIFELTDYIKIITDEELLEEIKKIFAKDEIEVIEKDLGKLTIIYNEDITKIPGVFAALLNELAMNDISIIDSMICQWEHIIIVKEKDLQKAFAVIYNLVKRE